ncbi:hypothetical protein [Oculatella sp. LEGE 06141]
MEKVSQGGISRITDLTAVVHGSSRVHFQVKSQQHPGDRPYKIA